MIIWLIYIGILLYWEAVYHIGCFGLTVSQPWIMLGILSMLASVLAFITGSVEQKHRRKCFWILLLPLYLIFAVQTVYYTIFRQPLQVRAMITGGQDALTNYWREMFLGIVKALPLLIVLAIPLIAALFVMVHRKKAGRSLPVWEGIQKVRVMFLFGVSGLFLWMILEIGEIIDADHYHEYTEFYDPVIVMQDAGVIAMVQRDLWFELETLADGVFASTDAKEDSSTEEILASREPTMGNDTDENAADEDPVGESAADEDPTDEKGKNDTAEGEEENGQGDTGNHGEEPAFQLDLVKLKELSAGDPEKEWLAEYISSLEPVSANEYTGIFEGYNLIYITAEGFSTYAIDEELTPTLYQLANSGFVCTNYYVPLWQTSTSDGEYVNLTGLIPDGQFSMKKTAQNHMAYSLPAFFGRENCRNMAYHNNTLSYYDRHLTHPNLGYDFKASKLGELSQEEWGSHLFYMENPDRWPASDLEMVQYTLPEYIDQERFNVYYMTVSGHMYYSFTGNSMSSKNRDAVSGLNMTENARAYIACHIELDKALEHLLTELEAAGKLENTVIALSADHYPYAMTEEQYEELAGKDLSADRDLYRNTLILWNAGMKKPVIVTKPCCSVDILPTLLNLFGFGYASGMYAGRDILSDTEGLVIFNDRSFVTDTVVYDRKSKTTTWRKELSDEEKESYLSEMKQEVKDRYQFSAYILREDYYDLMKQCEVE